MRLRVPESADGVEMLLSGVAFVAVEAVAWISAVQLNHQPIARDFRDDRSGGNRRTSPVAVKYAPLRHREIRHPKGIDEHDVRKRYERKHRALHRAQRRLMDVDAIDFCRVRGSHGPCDGVAENPVVETFTFGGRDQLGVGHAGNVLVRSEHDRRRNDGASQAASSYFIDAGHIHESHTAQRVLQRAHRGDSSHRVRWSWQAYCVLPPSFMRAALPFRSRR